MFIKSSKSNNMSTIKLKYKCKVCKRKCTLFTMWECKCSPSEPFCRDHRLPFDHECPIDYKENESIRLEKNNPAIVIHKRRKIE